MARGRMISASLGSSRKFRRLTMLNRELGEFAQILFVLLITRSDDFGLLEADAETVKLKVFPGTSRNESEIQAALTLLDEVGLIRLYEANEEQYLQVVKFDEHQTGLHKRTKPHFPEPPAGTPRKLPEIPHEEKGTELKGTEEKSKSHLPKAETDPRAHHPAIEAVKAVLKSYPDKILWDGLISVLGENPSSETLQACYVEWVARGYNKKSTKWVEWVSVGIPTGGNGKTRRVRTPRPGEIDESKFE